VLAINPIKEINMNELNYGSHLKFDELGAMKRLITKYKDLFPKAEVPIGQAKVKPVEFNTGDAKPVWQPVRRLAQKEKEYVKEQVEEMQRNSIIEPSRSPWQSPIHLVKAPEKPGTPAQYRIVGDYRKLNEVLLESRYPLPLIPDLLDQLKGSRYFTTLDLTQGFHQILVAKSSSDRLSITTTSGTFRPWVLPFGTNCSAAIFQQTMHEIFGDLLGKDLTSVYIDDIAFGQVTFHKHLQALERVFQRLRDANLTVNVKKCHFAMPQVKLLGFILSESRIAQDPDKIKSVKKWPRPVTVTDVR
jgi:hypothetical protein